MDDKNMCRVLFAKMSSSADANDDVPYSFIQAIAKANKTHAKMDKAKADRAKLEKAKMDRSIDAAIKKEERAEQRRESIPKSVGNRLAVALLAHNHTREELEHQRRQRELSERRFVEWVYIQAQRELAPRILELQQRLQHVLTVVPGLARIPVPGTQVPLRAFLEDINRELRGCASRADRATSELLRSYEQHAANEPQAMWEEDPSLWEGLPVRRPPQQHVSFSSPLVVNVDEDEGESQGMEHLFDTQCEDEDDMTMMMQ